MRLNVEKIKIHMGKIDLFLGFNNSIKLYKSVRSLPYIFYAVSGTYTM